MAGSVGAPAPPGQRYNAKGQLEAVPQGQETQDVATGAPVSYPLVGVDPSQMYDTASKSALSKQQFEQSQQAQANLLEKLPGVMNTVTGGGSVQYGGSGTDPAALQKAQEAAFARAKDQSGLLAKSAITGLRDSMAARGTLGSGLEGEQTAAILSGAAGGLGDVNRQQMEDALQIAQHQADTSYQGGITQRGQNIQAIQGLLSAMANAGRVY